MADHPRARRLAKRIVAIVATAIQRDIKDPRLVYVTITDARVTNDLHDATVYYTVRGESVDAPPDADAAAAALEKAKGQLRTMVGAGTGVRFTPTLTFVADAVPEAARRMEELVAQARAADEQVARDAAGAAYAGGADPYRKDGADEQEQPGMTDPGSPSGGPVDGGPGVGGGAG